MAAGDCSEIISVTESGYRCSHITHAHAYMMTSHDGSCLHVIVTDGPSMEQTMLSPVGHVKVEHTCRSPYLFTTALSTGPGH